MSAVLVRSHHAGRAAKSLFGSFHHQGSSPGLRKTYSPDGINVARHKFVTTSFAASKRSRPARSPWRTAAWLLCLGVYGVGSAVAGFYAMSSPLGGALLAKFGTLSDKESLLQYVPENEEARAVEDFINNHPLTAELRNDPKFVESRPHLKLPAAFRRQNLTAGMLLGPGRFVVPPVVFINDSESVVAISYLGPNLCGHPGLVHGGVLATMLDEGLARCCFDALPRKIAVTAKLEVNYRQPVRTGTYVVLRARTVRVEGRKAWVEGHLETLPDGDSKPVILAEASALYISPRPSTVLSKVL